MGLSLNSRFRLRVWGRQGLRYDLADHNLFLTAGKERLASAIAGISALADVVPEDVIYGDSGAALSADQTGLQGSSVLGPTTLTNVTVVGASIQYYTSTTNGGSDVTVREAVIRDTSARAVARFLTQEVTVFGGDTLELFWVLPLGGEQ